MSTKTISKRVALATVVALGAGVLSLVSVSSASAAQAAAGFNQSVAAANKASPDTDPASAAGTLNIASLNSALGAGAVTGLASTTFASFGLLNVSDQAGTLVAGTTQTATLSSSGNLTVYTATTATGAQSSAVITVTGGTISTTSLNGTNYNLGATAVASAGGARDFAVIISPSLGSSQMQVNLYTSDASTNSAAKLAANPALGTLKGSISVTVASANASGVLSVTKSAIVYNSTSTGNTTAATTAGIGTADYLTPQYGEISFKDAYSVLLPSTVVGYVTASASNGATVTLGTNGSPDTSSAMPTATSALTSYAGTAVGLAVGPGALASTGGSTTITISFNGTLVGTVSYTFTGPVTKVVLSSAGNGVASGTGAGNTVKFSMYDSVGNLITTANGAGSTAYPAFLTKDTNGFKSGYTNLGSTFTYPANATSSAAATQGTFLYTCVSGQNVTDVAQVDYLNYNNTVAVSNQIQISCSGTPYSYTATLDKASYNAGDVATLTVTFKDAAGSIAGDTTTGIADGTTAPTISVGGATLVAATTATDATTNGVKKYTLTVGTSAGSFNAVVSFPKVNTVNSAQSAVTVPFKVTDGSTSLNDVLKGIVSLIASINKQIAALAKLVTKK